MSSGDSYIPGVRRSLCDGLDGAYSVGLHVGAIFIVLGASIFGATLPIITKYIPLLRRNPFVLVVAKTAATGVLLSVSCIHLIQDGINSFAEPCIDTSFRNFYQPYGMLFALTAALLMHLIDFKLAEVAERWVRRRHAKEEEERALQSALGEAGGSTGVRDDGAWPVDVELQLANSEPAEERGDDRGSSGDTEPEGALRCENAARVPLGGGKATGPHCIEGFVEPEKIDVRGAAEGEAVSRECGVDGQPYLPGCGHCHEVVVPMDMGMMKRIVAAVCMEFGVALHSIFVGLDIGLTTDRDVKPLLVALVFHQVFEGMSLGSRLVDTNFRTALELVMVMIFSVSAPLGMGAATIAVSVSGDSMSGGGFVLMMGVLDSFCGGILLYLAFTLLLGDFSPEAKAFCADGVPHAGWKKFAMFVALWVGMLGMAIVGRWL